MAFIHDYVELNIRIWEKFPSLDLNYVKVPKWWAKMWYMPDSSWQVAGKNLAYHFGHVSAAGSAIVAVGVVGMIVL